MENREKDNFEQGFLCSLGKVLNYVKSETTDRKLCSLLIEAVSILEDNGIDTNYEDEV